MTGPAGGRLYRRHLVGKWRGGQLSLAVVLVFSTIGIGAAAAATPAQSGLASRAQISGAVGETVSFTSGGAQPLVPARLMDSRPGAATVDGVAAGVGAVGAGASLDLDVTGRGGVPEVGVGAVVLNVTAAAASEATFVTVWPTGEARPLASNLNPAPGVGAAPNLVLAKVGVGGRVSFFNFAGETHLIADVVAWFPEGIGAQPLVPARLMDSRTGAATVDGGSAGFGALAADAVLDLDVTGRGGVPEVGVGAVVLNVTAAAASEATFVTVWPTGEARPLASNLNPAPGVGAAPNLVLAKVGVGGRVSFFNFAGETHLIADVVAWFPEGIGAQPLVPARLMDSRTGAATVDGGSAGFGALAADAVLDLDVTGRGGVPEVGVGAVVLNVTAAAASEATFVTVWPTGEARPLASNLNPAPGVGAAPNLVLAKVGVDGRVSFYNFSGSTHLIADVVGWFPDGTSGTTTMIVKQGTEFAGSGDVVSFSGSSNVGGSVVLAASADVPPLGGHLAVANHPAVPGGFAGKVTAVAASGAGTTTVALSPANLQDIFANVVVHGTITPTGPGVTTSVALAAPAHLGVPKAACGGQLSSVPTVSFDGYDGTLDFDLLGGKARVVISANASIEWGISPSISIGCDISTPKVLVATVGPVTFEVGLTVQVSVSASVGASLTTTVPIQIGFNYDQGVVTNLSGADILGSTTASPDLTASISASVFAGASMDVKLLGIGGLNITVGPRVTLTISGSCIRLVGDLVIQASVVAGRWGIEWSFALADVSLASRTLYQHGCGGMAWTGTINVAIDRLYDSPGRTIRQAESASYTLNASHDATVLGSDGSGSYIVTLSGSGSSSTTSCVIQPRLLSTTLVGSSLV